MKDSSIKGTLTELQCQKDFIERGFIISQPITSDSKYDFIADVNHKLIRIQCKSATLLDNGSRIKFGTKTTNIRAKTSNYYSPEDVDYFYTCYEAKSYLVPVKKAARGNVSLRFSAQINNPNIKWASDYELDKVLQEIIGQQAVEKS